MWVAGWCGRNTEVKGQHTCVPTASKVNVETSVWPEGTLTWDLWSENSILILTVTQKPRKLVLEGSFRNTDLIKLTLS